MRFSFVFIADYLAGVIWRKDKAEIIRIGINIDAAEAFGDLIGVCDVADIIEFPDVKAKQKIGNIADDQAGYY